MIKILRFAFKGSYSKFALIMLITCIYSALVSLGEPFAQKYLINEGLMKGNVKVLVMVGIGIALLGQVLCFFNYTQGNLIKELKNRVFNSLASRAAKDFVKLDYGKYMSREPGYYSSRIAEETRSLSDIAVAISVGAFGDLLSLIFAIGFCIFISWKLTLILLAICPVLYFLGQRFSRNLKKFSETERENLAEYRASVIRFVSAFKVMRIFSLDSVAMKNLDADFQKYVQDNNSRTRVALRFACASRSLVSASNCMFLLCAGLAVIFKELTIGDYFAYSSVFWKIMPAVSNIAGVLPQLSYAQVLHERLTEMGEPETLDKETPVRNPTDALVNLRNISFGYASSDLLGGLSLDIQPGENVYIKGANGMGKSTLAHIVCGLIQPREGKQWVPDLVDISAQLAPLTFFKASLREHLRLDETDAVKRARILQMIDAFKLSDKLDRDPQSFSEGEKKKAMLIIALAKPSKLYIFDEPFAAVDEESKETIYTWIRQSVGKAATVFITHGDEHIMKGLDRKFELLPGQLRPIT